MSGNTKASFLRGLDVFVMPTYFEGLPVSLLECMSYGVVPVVTSVGSIPDVVKEDINGKFIKVKDIDSIVTTVKQLIDDVDSINRLSQNARETIFTNFSAEVYISKLNDIYSSLEK